MTLEQARKQNLEIFTVTAAQVENFIQGCRDNDREAEMFTHQCFGVDLILVAVGKRSDSGKIAAHMKSVL